MARLKQWHRKPVAELSIEDGFGVWFERYHKHMQVNGYTEQTLTQKRETIRYFVAWCEERGLEKPYQVTEEVVNRYKHHLHYAPSQTGEPLSVSTQRLRLTSVKVFFRYLMEQRFIEVNPCKTLQLPRVKHKVCRDFLALEEVETVLLEPDLSKPTGIRDRAMMELFFSSGLRRNELTHIGVFDVNMVDRKLNIVEGKGGKQRVIPMTSRACMWLEHYMDGVRPQLDKKLTDRLFLGRYGQPLSNGTVTRSFGQYIKRFNGNCTESQSIL